jgi:integrase
VANHHPALPFAKVPDFLRALRAADAGATLKLAFEFLVLTAARTGEVLGARWDEIDLEAKTWTVPANRIKAGREHRVPLAPRCLELLEQAKPLAGDSDFVFTGRSGKPLSNMALLMLLRRMGRADVTAHGFRSSFRDWSAERTNIPRAVCEAALAHVVKDRAEAAYFRSDLFEQRRALMEKWEQYAIGAAGSVVRISA